MLKWRLGTMGFGYSDWSGVFYPRDLKPADYLAFYAKYFDAVELDTTFHAIPPADRVRRWADETPPGFRFAAKAPRAVTHEGPLDRQVDPMFEFLDAIGELHQKLAVVLLQFPPSFTVQQLPRLRTFAGAMPDEMRFAVEFRHPSWDSLATADLLQERRWCWAAADYANEPPIVPVTTDFLYVRWIGQHGRFQKHDRERLDPTPRLRQWKSQITGVAAGLRALYGFFNNDFAGYAIGSANRFKKLIGQTPRAPTPRERGELFG